MFETGPPPKGGPVAFPRSMLIEAAVDASAARRPGTTSVGYNESLVTLRLRGRAEIPAVSDGERKLKGTRCRQASLLLMVTAISATPYGDRCSRQAVKAFLHGPLSSKSVDSLVLH